MHQTSPLRTELARLSEKVKQKLIGRAIRTPVMRLAFGHRGPESPIVIFHHIPRSGGTSLLRVLGSWYTLITDYRSGWSASYPEKLDLDCLSARYCLAGHFETAGNYLHERYPEVIDSSRFVPITMLRDPLDVKCSLWSFERAHGVSTASSLEEHLLERPNYIATILPASWEDYRNVVDRYSFVGILEHAQESADLLSVMLGKAGCLMPTLNRTTPVSGDLSTRLVKRFRDGNRLDYAIYEYGLARYRELARSLRGSSSGQEMKV